MSRTTYGIDKADKRLMVQGFVQRGVNTSNAGKAWAGRLGDAVPKDCTGTPVAYEWDLDDNHLNNAGAGGLWTTAEDMVKSPSKIL